jgi:hypothetical protein
MNSSCGRTTGIILLPRHLRSLGCSLDGVRRRAPNVKNSSLLNEWDNGMGIQSNCCSKCEHSDASVLNTTECPLICVMTNYEFDVRRRCDTAEDVLLSLTKLQKVMPIVQVRNTDIYIFIVHLCGLSRPCTCEHMTFNSRLDHSASSMNSDANS